MKIIQVRGTSGSGKTWVAKSLIQKLTSSKSSLTEVFTEGRKKPLFYTIKTFNSGTLAILGHYESNCGGCDNIGSAAQIYELIEDIRSGKFKSKGVDTIFCEGLLLSEDTKWTLELASKQVDFKILFLTTPVDKCIEQIKSRRELVGNTKPLKEDNTRNRVRVIDRAFEKLNSHPKLVGNLVKSSSQGAWKLITYYLGL